MSAGKSRFSLGEVDVEEVEIPAAPMIARPVPELVRPAEKGIEPEIPITTKIEKLAETDFTPTEVRVNTSLSLPKSLNADLDARVFELKLKGFKKMSRQAVMEEALREFLNKPRGYEITGA